MEIILNEYKNTESVNNNILLKENFVRSSKLIQNNHFEKIIDQQQVFLDERESCGNYNLNVTIEPYCTNVLFNPTTEISSGGTQINDKNLKYETILNGVNSDVEFKPGYDIFNNHVFRRKVFKTGETIHDYNIDEINSFQNTITNYLVENEGWIGFPNQTQIGGKNLFKNKKSCEFIDMYPDRSLFSFKEKYVNDSTQYNWKYCITYSNREIYDHPLVGNYNGDVLENGIKIIEYAVDQNFVTESTPLNNNSVNYLNLKTEYNHGLKVGDQIEIDGLEDSSGNNIFNVHKLGGNNGFDNKNNNFVIKGDFSNYKLSNQNIYFDINVIFKINYNDGGIITSDIKTKANSPISFEITPNEGYLITGFEYAGKFYYINGSYSDLTIQGSEINGIKVNISNIVRETTGNTTTITGYLRKDKYTLNLYTNNTDHCYITPGKTEILTGGTFVFDYNTSVDLIAWTDYINYYSFSGWYLDWTGNKDTSKLLSKEKNFKLSITDNYNITGVFELISENQNSGITTDVSYKFIENTSSYSEPSYSLTQKSVNPYFIGDKFSIPILNKRIRKVKNGVKSKYYIRVFKKINVNDIKIEYPLAFSRTIYNDSITQIGYVSDVNLSNYIDNKNRPLTEIFFTIIKNNVNGEESGIFTPIISGVEGDKLMNNYNVKKINLIDVNLPIESNITIDNEEFYGDIIEYNPIELIENKLVDIQHRFNTNQREFYTNNLDIWYTKYPTDKKMTKIKGKNRKEGYYYKPHYRIPIKGLSKNINQIGLSEILTCEDKLINGSDFLEITTQKKQSLNVNDLVKIYLYDNNDKLFWSQFCVVKNINDKKVVISKPLNFSQSKKLKIRLIPNNSPLYFEDLNDGRTLYREVLGTWDLSVNEKLKELKFSNGRLYVNDIFKFYMKRQDPFGESGLLYTSFPNDIIGTKTSENEYDSEINEIDNLC